MRDAPYESVEFQRPTASAIKSPTAVGITAVNDRLENIIQRLRNIADRADSIHARVYGPTTCEVNDDREFGIGTMENLLCVEALLSSIETTLQHI